MTTTTYIVKFTKHFVSGSLRGLTYDTEVSYPNLDAASRYVSFCHDHLTKPVKAFGGSNYTCHTARIVPVTRRCED